MSNDETIARYQQLLERYPGNELARFSLGKAYFDRGDFARAQAEFAQALAQKPDWMVITILLGKCALALNDRGGARQAFERALALAIAQKHEGPQLEMEEALKDLAG